MISNLQKAARDRETVMIGGGEFGPDEFRLAAHMLDCYPEMLEALEAAQRWVAMYHSLPGHDAASRCMSGVIDKALAKANQHWARGFA